VNDELARLIGEDNGPGGAQSPNTANQERTVGAQGGEGEMIDRQALHSCLSELRFPAGPDEICEHVERCGGRCPAELAAALEALPTRLYLSEEEVLAFLGQREGVRQHR
jgi:hypothetical protein